MKGVEGICLIKWLVHSWHDPKFNMEFKFVLALPMSQSDPAQGQLFCSSSLGSLVRNMEIPGGQTRTPFILKFLFEHRVKFLLLVGIWWQLAYPCFLLWNITFYWIWCKIHVYMYVCAFWSFRVPGCGTLVIVLYGCLVVGSKREWRAARYRTGQPLPSITNIQYRIIQQLYF